jgi:hypothetical protein
MGHPRQPIIGDRVEASFNVFGRVLFLAGFVVAVLWSPAGWVVIAAGLALFVLYLRRVGRRLGLVREDRRLLRRWLGTGALYRSLLTLLHGHDGTVPRDQ